MFATLEYLSLITELPWQRFTLRHIGVVHLLYVFIIMYSFYLVYSVLHPEKRMGRLLLKVSSSEANYLFYFGFVGWLLFLVLIFSRIGRDFTLYLQWNNLPRTMVDDMMMQSVARNTISFVTFFFLGIAFLIGTYSHLEIREKGLRTGASLVHWQKITQLEWIDSARVRIYYESTTRWKKTSEEFSVLWEIKAEEASTVRKLLEEQVKPHI